MTQNTPALRGEVTENNEKVGRIGLWYDRKFNPKAPLYRGEIEINGKTLRVALWEGKPE